MAAFNAVRFRVKPGRDQDFLDAHRSVHADWPGLTRANIIKTGDHSYCIIAEWVDEKVGPDKGIADSYSFSKEVVQVWTMRSSRATQKEHRVRVNSVCPAPIETPLLKDFRQTMSDKLIDWTITEASGAAKTPREVAMPLAFLGSEASIYVNGLNLIADGGFTAAMTTGQVDFSALA
jgi:NAD(P)-dependent dehydrogenase (short-subunit alcohol dehydrogenase family)